MNAHWHGSIENILWTGLAAILVINLGRLVAARMAQQGGILGEVGVSLGGIVK